MVKVNKEKEEERGEKRKREGRKKRMKWGIVNSDWWSRAWSVVKHSTFVFYTHPRRTLLNGLRKVGQDGIGSSHGVQADSRLSSHDRCLRTTGGGSHRSAGERLQIGLRRQRLLPSQLHARLGHGGPGLF